MTISLAKDLRNTLAKTTAAARLRAESASKAALENLAVHEKEYRSHMTVEQRTLRNQLRARGRALGDPLDKASGIQEVKRLTEAAAYEHWHRLLFTRFLAENDLLHTGKEHGNVPVTLQDCEELAAELGARDGFDLACRFSAEILPGVFRSNDPVLDLRLALNDEVELRRLLDSLPSDVFTADDTLGWTYQYWQAQRKDEVNASGKKIGADELPSVTQLFTEDYMVEFLLHNTLGAWWAGKLGPIEAANEEDARVRASLPVHDGLSVNWTYLRFIQDEESNKWSPAAGTFDGWPTEVEEIKFLDPCMGSGHFLVFALPIIARLRMEEEGLSPAEAVHATIADNLHGLEIDERCSQIAAFNLALTAWKIGGYQPLPLPHLACSGLAPNAPEKDWVKLAGNDEKLKNGMKRLYELFRSAPILGSLINPKSPGRMLLEADFIDLQPLFEKALAKEADDAGAHELVVIASGVAKAAEILAGQFTLVATNVPYLVKAKQIQELRVFCETYAFDASADLATVFLERCADFCAVGGTHATVTPQNWLFLKSYLRFRRRLLTEGQVVHATSVGSGATATASWDVLRALPIVNCTQSDEYLVTGIETDASQESQRAADLKSLSLHAANSTRLLANPDSRIALAAASASNVLLSRFADSLQGVSTGDNPRFQLLFWEVSDFFELWAFQQGTVAQTMSYGGREKVIRWDNGKGALAESESSAIRGLSALGRAGITVTQMRNLPSTIFSGSHFDTNVAVIVPKDDCHFPAIWAYCSSNEFLAAVRRVDKKINVTNATFGHVPFDLAHWEKVATERFPDGLPKPFSSDPTQWLFNGHPSGADQPLHVAVARLLGYQWPRQTGSNFPDSPALGPDNLVPLADQDGIVCLPPINKEQPGAQRLRSLLVQALGSSDEKTLVAAAGKKGSKANTLENWLRDEFFEQHCDLFHNRPFIWHVWDGQKDGFSALVNYHKLDRATLQKLTYSYLGDWIRQQDEDAKGDKPGAAIRLGAARKLQAELANILKGEAPYDIFVRWKPIAKQAIGWNPDINDGVRLNIRPFLTATDVGKKGAGILRSKPNIKWDKDRGKEPHRDRDEFPWFWCENEPGTDPVGEKAFTGNRWNNVHLTLSRKRA
ncbi:MAG: SAM-dependent DNA methyltransferase [Pyrinomonadaceae bacterium]